MRPLPDEVRRQLRAARKAQREALRPWRESLLRTFTPGPSDPAVPAAEKAELALGGLARRRVLTLGGLSVFTAAVLAACGDDDEVAIPLAGEATTTTMPPEREITDVTILRTASSLEQAAIEVYELVIAEGLLQTQGLVQVAELFAQHHTEHRDLWLAATRDAGAPPYREANPAVMEGLVAPFLETLPEAEDPEQAVLRFAWELEVAAAATYQSATNVLSTPVARQGAMSIGGVEARHAAVLASTLEGFVILGGETAAETIAPTTVAGDAPAEGEGEAAAAAGGDEEVVEIAQVPGPFWSVDAALGPNSFIYLEEDEQPTTDEPIQSPGTTTEDAEQQRLGTTTTTGS